MACCQPASFGGGQGIRGVGPLSPAEMSFKGEREHVAHEDDRPAVRKRERTSNMTAKEEQGLEKSDFC